MLKSDADTAFEVLGYGRDGKGYHFSVYNRLFFPGRKLQTTQKVLNVVIHVLTHLFISKPKLQTTTCLTGFV